MHRNRKIIMVIFHLLITISFAIPSFADDLTKYRDRANSDDAVSVDEAFFHGQARALVIMEVQPNKLRVGGREFRVKRNPVGKGCFVYDPRTIFSGVKRNLVWWVLDENRAYALNSPSKMVTPSLKWPREDGIHEPSTAEIVAYVFDKKPMSHPNTVSEPSTSNEKLFTVKEYKIFRAVIDTPMSISEEQALQNVGRRYGVTSDEAKKIVRKVQSILSQKKWFGSPESEIMHASDWIGEKP
jgi:hypothetical protein